MRETARAFVISDIIQATTLSHEMRKYPARPFPARRRKRQMQLFPALLFPLHLCGSLLVIFVKAPFIAPRAHRSTTVARSR